MITSDSVFKHCQVILLQHASYLRDAPCANTESIAEQVEEVARLLDKYMACVKNTYPSCTAGSQGKEDEILLELFPADTPGMYIDIGAGTPKECSNTWAMYARSWRGLLVEPMKDHIYQLARWRIGDVILPVAVSDYSGMMPMYAYSCQLLTSCDPEWCDDPSEPIAVECMTVTEILERGDCSQFVDADFCNIDVEGHELQVLKGIPWDKFHPDVFCVEYRKYGTDGQGDDLSGQWEHLLLENDYRLHATTDMNKFYVSTR